MLKLLKNLSLLGLLALSLVAPGTRDRPARCWTALSISRC